MTGALHNPGLALVLRSGDVDADKVATLCAELGLVLRAAQARSLDETPRAGGLVRRRGSRQAALVQPRCATHSMKASSTGVARPAWAWLTTAATA